jgi:CRP-like cAMP-binding protein
MSQGRPVDVPLLRQFAPLDGMKKENQASLARKVFIREMDPGRLLFKQGDTDKRTSWIVAGTVELREDERTVGVIKGGSPEARQPISAKLPRVFSARAMDAV